jgi:glutamyl-tRNA reductase
MLISTCNRVELVAAGRQGAASDLERVAEDARAAVVELAPSVAGHLYVHEGRAAVEHLFRVAASLDSLVLGEPQILGQVKDAFETARRAGTIGGCLHRTVPRAIRTAKRVRTETAIGSGQVSVPSVAVDLAHQIFGQLAGRTVVLLGSGEMAETVAKLLRNAGTRLLVVGRNEARVGVLAGAVGGEPRRWADLSAALIEADVVITSTSAPGHVVGYDSIASIRRKRKGRSLFFIDLAVPRDVDPKVESLSEIFLYNVDDFDRVVAESLHSRKKEAQQAEEIVQEETKGWERWADAAAVTPVVVALRERFIGVLSGEIERSLRGRLKELGETERAALAAMVEAAVNKLLHAPSARLREIAADRDYEGWRVAEVVETMKELFDLEHEDPSDEPEVVTGEQPKKTGTLGSR